MNTNAISNNGNPNFNDISEMQKYLDRLRQLTEVRRMAELEQRAAQDVLQSGYGGPSSGVNDLMPSAVYGGQAGFGLKNNPGLGPPREMYEQQRMIMDGQGHTATFGMGSSGGGGSGSAGSGSGSVSGGGIGSGHPLDQGLGLATADSKIGYKNTEQTGYVTKNEFRNLQGSVNQLVEMMTAQLMLQSTSPQQAHSRGGGIPLHSVAGGGGGFDPYLSAIGNQSNYLASLMAKKQHSTMRNNMNANSPSINGINSMFSAYPSIQPGFSPNLAQQIPGIPNPYLAQQQQQQLQQQQQQQQLAQNIITVRSRPATANPDIKPSPNEQQAVTDDSKNSNNGDERVSIFDENAYANAYMENLVSEFKAFHWKIQNWDQLEKRVTSDTFECGGHTWRILLRPFGSSHTDIVSLFLEYANAKEAPEGWHAIAQFVLSIANVKDPSINTQGSAFHCFNKNDPNWGFTRFMKLSELLCNNFDDGGRPIIEDGECVVSAFVKVIVSPTGMPYVQQPQPTQPQPTDSSNTNNPNPGNNNNTVNSGNNNPKLNPSIKEKKSIP